MAGNPTFEVLQTYRDHLAPLMPSMPDPPPGHSSLVPVFYAHPGDRFTGNSLVWFDEISDTTEIASLRATPRRRLSRVEFKIVIVTVRLGTTDDDDQSLQYTCDLFVESIRRIIDLDVATEEHLQSPSLIDAASVDGSRTDRGPTDTGRGTRLTMDVSFEARYL